MEHGKVFWAAALGRLSFIYKMGEGVKGVVAAIDIPEDWFESYGESPTKEKVRCIAADFFFCGVPSGTRTHGLQIHNLAR